MAVVEFDGKLLVIDCGVLFPEAEQPGVDLILPDFGIIEHRLDDVAAVVLTHGHEDHIGAIRSEEHTSELQSRQYLVCRLLLEKKKKKTQFITAIKSINIV